VNFEPFRDFAIQKRKKNAASALCLKGSSILKKILNPKARVYLLRNMSQ